MGRKKTTTPNEQPMLTAGHATTTATKCDVRVPANDTTPTVEAPASLKVIDSHVCEQFAMYRGDSCEVLQGLPERSAHLSVFSPPFASLYTFSNSDRDVGNVADHAQFFDQFVFIVKGLTRVMREGRIAAVHCMDLPTSKERDGYIGITDFRGELVRAFASVGRCPKCFLVQDRPEGLKHGAKFWPCLGCATGTAQGWVYHSLSTIWKDPVTAMQRTKALGLLHKTVRGNASMSRMGIPDYLVAMRAPGEVPRDERVRHAETEYDVNHWQKIASPVWDDIDPNDTLQHESARDADDERHICPLQLEVIRRAVELWSSPGEVVISPFAGIGSEGYVALGGHTKSKRAILPRKFVGIELKGSYYAQAVKNLIHATKANRQQSLFDAPTRAPMPAVTTIDESSVMPSMPDLHDTASLADTD